MSRYSGFVPVYLSSCDSVDLTSVWTCLLEVLKYFYGVYSIKFLSWSPAINQVCFTSDVSCRSIFSIRSGRFSWGIFLPFPIPEHWSPLTCLSEQQHTLIANHQDISHKSVEKVYLLSSVLCSSAIGHCSPDIWRVDLSGRPVRGLQISSVRGRFYLFFYLIQSL